MSDEQNRPALVVFSHVFPNPAQKTFGLFIRERMFRVGADRPITVVAPVPWFPGQGRLRRLRPGYRPAVPCHEVQQGIDVYHPRFLSIPRFLKFTDGLFEALFSLPLLLKLKRKGRLDILDAHFIHPDGIAAWLLGKWLRVPYTITLRGALPRIARTRLRRRLAIRAMRSAARVFAVSDSLRQLAISLGIGADHVQVVSNGINLDLFQPENKLQCRQELGIDPQAKVLLTVGTLTENKGFHRVMEQLPALLERFPNLIYLIVGGEHPNGDEQRLRRIAGEIGVADRVKFMGVHPPERLRYFYSAADLYVMPSRTEGWANVFLEAAACGLPAVATRVGGNAEVISSSQVGTLVPYGDGEALRNAIVDGLEKRWDVEAIIAHARDNAWEKRIGQLLQAFDTIHTGNQPRERG